MNIIPHLSQTICVSSKEGKRERTSIQDSIDTSTRERRRRQVEYYILKNKQMTEYSGQKHKQHSDQPNNHN